MSTIVWCYCQVVFINKLTKHSRTYGKGSIVASLHVTICCVSVCDFHNYWVNFSLWINDIKMWHEKSHFCFKTQSKRWNFTKKLIDHHSALHRMVSVLVLFLFFMGMLFFMSIFDLNYLKIFHEQIRFELS